MKLKLQRLTSSISANLRISLFLALALEIISSLQIIHITIRIIFDQDDQYEYKFATLLKYISSIGGTLDILLSFDSQTSLLRFLGFCSATYFLAHILIFIFLLYLGDKQIYNIHAKYWKTIATLYIIHSRLIFFLLQHFLFKLMRLYNDCDKINQGPFFCETKWLVATIFSVCVNSLVSFKMEFFLYQINKTRNTYGIKDNLFHLLKLLHKNCILGIYFFIWNLDYTVILCLVMNYLFLIACLYILSKKVPFYNSKLQKTSMTMMGLLLSFTFIVTLRAFHVDQELLEVLSLVLPCLSIPISLTCADSLSRSIIGGGCDTPEKAIQFAMLLKNYTFKPQVPTMFSAYTSRELLIAKGILKNHKIDFMKISEENKIAVIQEVYQYIMKILNKSLDKNPKSAVLLLFMAKISLKKLRNLPMALSLSARAEAVCKSIPLRNSFESHNTLLKTFYSKEFLNLGYNLDILKYFEYRTFAKELQEKIRDETDLNLNIWHQIKKKEIDLKQFIDQIDKIDVISTYVEKTFSDKYSEFIKYFRPILLTYELYLDMDQNYTGKSRKHLEKFLQVNDNYSSKKFDAFSEEIAVVITSLDKNKADIIADASASIQSFFHMKKTQLLGQSITCLFPSFFAKQYLQRIREYVESYRNGANSLYKTCGRTRNDDIFEIEVYFQLYPHSNSGMRLMTVFRKIITSDSIMIVGHKGNIIDCAESIRKYLNIDLVNLRLKNIEELVSDFHLINKAFNVTCTQKHQFDYLASDMITAQGQNINLVEDLVSTPGLDFTSQNGLLEDEERSVLDTIQAQYKKNTELNVNSVISGEPLPKLGLCNPKLYQTKSTFFKDQTISFEKCKEIHDRMAQGDKLLFPINQKGRAKNLKMEFQVTIEPHLVDGEVYKVLRLSNGEIKFDKTLNKLESSQNRKFTLESPTISIMKKGGVTVTKIDLKNDTDAKTINTILQDKDENVIDHLIKPSALLPKLEAAHKMKTKINIQKSISSVTSSAKMEMSIKELRETLSDQKSYPFASKTLWVIHICIALLICLTSVNLVISNSSVHRIRGDVNIIGLSNSRLTYALRAHQILIRIYLRVVGIFPVYPQLPDLIVSLYNEKVTMLDYNRQLTNNISIMSEENNQQLMYSDDVNLWEPSQDNVSKFDKTNTFMTTNILANKLDFMRNFQGNVLTLVNRSDLLYPLNNTINDYLLSSERMIFEIQNMLESNIQSKLVDFEIFIALASVIGFVMVLSLGLLAWKIVDSHYRLFWALSFIDEASVDERIHQIEKIKNLIEKDSENKEIIPEVVEFFQNEEKKQDVKQKSSKFTRKYRKYNTRSITIALLKSISLNLAIILFIITLFTYSYFQSQEDYDRLYQLSLQLGVTTKAQYQVSFLVSIFYYAILFKDFGTMLIRNQSPLTQLNDNMKSIKNINQDLYRVFRGDGTYLDPLVDEILNYKVCDYLPNESKSQCNTATRDQQAGILTINSNLIFYTQNYLDIYLKTPTYATAANILTPYSSVVRPNRETLEATYTFLTKYILSSADTIVTTFLQNKIIISIVILLLIIFYMFIAHYGTFKQFNKIDRSRGEIIKFIPYDMLLKTQAIRYYLSRDFAEASRLVKEVN